MRLSDFDFPYPEELVAAYPIEPRDCARLMVLRRAGGSPEHLHFRDLPDLLDPDDCVVLNRTRVYPARMLGKKSTGGRTDVLLVREVEPDLWAVLSSGLKTGTLLVFAEGLEASVEGLTGEGEYLCRFNRTDILHCAERQGSTPLPPYIAKRRRSGKSAVDHPADQARYQTVYARQPGSIAAPTAGLHFTMEVLSRLAQRGIRTAWLTLHVGRGTFRPIDQDDPDRHRMLPEWFRMQDAEAATVSQAMSEGRRVVSVGTTATRTLETLALGGKVLGAAGRSPSAEEGLARKDGGFSGGEGWTDLYIRPGHEWGAVRALITNFHLPRSTPLMLASAFIGRERLLAAYQEAFERRYRLFSYGDAMLIL